MTVLYETGYRISRVCIHGGSAYRMYSGRSTLYLLAAVVMRSAEWPQIAEGLSEYFGVPGVLTASKRRGMARGRDRSSFVLHPSSPFPCERLVGPPIRA